MLGLGLGLPQYLLRHSAASRWTPAALFAQGQQGVWYEPKPEYLFQDAAGTVPVTADGDPVGLMQDLSGNGNHATQAVAAGRPIYRTDGVRHWLEGDGVNDLFDFPLAPFRDSTNPSDAFTAIDVTNINLNSLTVGPDSGYFLLSNDGGTSDLIFSRFSSSLPIRINGTDVSAPTRGDLYNFFSGGCVVGVQSFTSETPSDVGVHHLLAGRSSAGLRYNFGGKFYGWVERKGPFAVDERGNVESYLSGISGVPL